jgi:Flp pilus assembly protein TadB
VHVVKAAAVRPAITATTGGAANVPVSISEDVLAAVISILSIVIPAVVVGLVIILTSFVIWWLWRRLNAARKA